MEDDKTLIYNINFCRICQNPSNLDLISTSSTINEREETYLDVLKYIFRDIIWVEDNFISLACTNCLNKVQEIAEFKRFCLNTNIQRETFLTQEKDTYPIKVELDEAKDGPYESSPELEDENQMGVEMKGKNISESTDRFTNIEERPEETTTPKGTKTTFKNHDKKSGRKKHKCEICGELFNYINLLQRHVYRHNGTRNYVCSVCGQKYVTDADLRKHLQLHTAGFDFACPLCPKKFRTSSNLRTHKNFAHRDPKDYKHQCTECGRKFACATGLKVHLKRHNKICDFPCDLCPKAFISKDELRTHLTSHSNIRAFKCDLCPAEYKIRRFLLIHKTDRHGIGKMKRSKAKTYDCSHCGKSITHKAKFERHLRKHTGEKPFKCRLCDARFVCKSYVKPHLKKVHDIELQKGTEGTLYYDIVNSQNSVV